MSRMAEVEVVVTYRATIEIPDGATTHEYVYDCWQEYEDELMAEHTEREVISEWTEDEDEEGENGDDSIQ